MSFAPNEFEERRAAELAAELEALEDKFYGRDNSMWFAEDAKNMRRAITDASRRLDAFLQLMIDARK